LLNYYIKRSARSKGGWGDKEFITGKRDRKFITERDREFVTEKDKKFIAEKDGKFITKRDGEFIAEKDKEFITKRDGEVGSGEKNRKFIAGEGVSNADIKRFLKGEAMGDRIG